MRSARTIITNTPHLVTGAAAAQIVGAGDLAIGPQVGVLPVHDAHVGQGLRGPRALLVHRTHAVHVVAGGAVGLGIPDTVPVRIPHHPVHVQVIPVSVGGDVAQVQPLFPLVAEKRQPRARPQRIARRWRVAVGEERVAIALGQADDARLLVTGVAQRGVVAAVYFRLPARDVQPAQFEAIGRVVVVPFRAVGARVAVHVLLHGQRHVAGGAADVGPAVAGDVETVGGVVAHHVGRGHALDHRGLVVVEPLAGDRGVRGPVGLGLGHAVNGPARTVADVAGRGLAQGLPVCELHAAVHVCGFFVGGMAGRAALGRAAAQEGQVCSVRARGQGLGGDAVAGAAGAREGGVPARGEEGGRGRRFPTGRAVAVAAAVGARGRTGVVGHPAGVAPERALVHGHVLLAVGVPPRVGDGGIVHGRGRVAGGAGDARGPAVAVGRRQVRAVRVRVQGGRVAVAAVAAQAAHELPGDGLGDEGLAARRGVAVAHRVGAGAGGGVVGGGRVQFVEHHVLEGARLGGVALVGVHRRAVAGAAEVARGAAQHAHVRAVRRLILVQRIARGRGRRRLAVTARATADGKAVQSGRVVVAVVRVAGGAVRAAEVLVLGGVESPAMADHVRVAGRAQPLVADGKGVGACEG